MNKSEIHIPLAIREVGNTINDTIVPVASTGLVALTTTHIMAGAGGIREVVGAAVGSAFMFGGMYKSLRERQLNHRPGEKQVEIVNKQYMSDSTEIVNFSPESEDLQRNQAVSEPSNK